MSGVATNAGTHQVSAVMHDRAIQGLHLCENDVFILMEAFRTREDAMLAVSETAWRGPCDLCRYTETLTGLLQSGGDEDAGGG